MESIVTYVFFDLETTDLWKNDNKAEIIEMSLLAVNREHLLKTEPNKEFRVQHKLRLAFKPHQKIQENASALSCLTNDLLQNEEVFNYDACIVIDAFIRRLKRPVCLIAHNGFEFHFRILNHYIRQMNGKLQEDILCTDSIYGFYDILHGQYKCGTGAQRKTLSQLKEGRTLFYVKGQKPSDSYKLGDIYKRVVHDNNLLNNRAENQCDMIMKIGQANLQPFVNWVDENHCLLSEIE